MPSSLISFAIPLWSVLAVYGAFMAFFALYVLFNLYHLLRFGTFGPGLALTVALFSIGTAALLLVSYDVLSAYDWTATIPLSDLFQGGASVPYFPRT